MFPTSSSSGRSSLNRVRSIAQQVSTFTVSGSSPQRAMSSSASAAFSPTSSANAGKASTDLILHESLGNNFHAVTLNREKKFNSLNLDMILGLDKLYTTDLPKNSVIWLSGAGEKAFCAGGDVAAIAEGLKKQDSTVGANFFYDEYKLDYKVAKANTENKVTISVWDKIVMGGGVGLGVHNLIRLVTERTMFAMPETMIGLFPDVGMTWGLTNLNHNYNQLAIGRFLGLTGMRLNGADCLMLGIGTHYLQSADLLKVKEALQQANWSDGDITPEKVISVVDKAVAGSGAAASIDPTLTPDKLALIEEVFGVDSLPEVYEKLEASSDEYAALILKTLNKMSPLSLRLTWESMNRHNSYGKDLQKGDSEGYYRVLREILEIEYRMAVWCCRDQPGSDFGEGVTALLVEKRKPNWSNKNTAEVAPALIEEFFLKLDKNFPDQRVKKSLGLQ